MIEKAVFYKICDELGNYATLGIAFFLFLTVSLVIFVPIKSAENTGLYILPILLGHVCAGILLAIAFIRILVEKETKQVT
jgi:hypothetical protein